MADVRPRIGLTTYVERAAWGHWSTSAALLPMSYVLAVSTAGGRPILLPPIADPGQDAVQAVRGLDGLILTGGCDVEPRRFGATAHAETGPAQPERDQAEIVLLEAALAADVPVLGICRGMQVLNIVCGGDLHQHVPEVVGHLGHNERLGAFSEHAVAIDAGSRLAVALGSEVVVKSHHHQAPATVGERLVVTARAPDGTVEGIEHTARRFAVGVLWHPEEGVDLRLFSHFVEVCRGARSVPQVA